MRRIALPSLAMLFVVTGIACFGGGEGGDPAVNAEIERLDGTALVADETPMLAPIAMSESGRPQTDLGDGVQVFQVSPVGSDRRPLQAAVVFDRAMVPLTGLADMNAKLPLSCSPDAGLSGRWAGTSTAVLMPESGEFALATEFTCSVPAGTAAIDGVTLEKDLSWSFETARPRVTSSTPYRGASRWEPQEPLTLRFDQPVTLESVKAHTKVKRSGNPVPVTITADPDQSNGFLVKATLSKDTEYELVVEPGVLATAGPLPSTESLSTTFRTYPPLAAEAKRPLGDVRPHESLSIEFTTPVSRSQVAEHLTVDPEPPGWEPQTGDWTSTNYWYYPSWQPRTSYTVTLAAGLEDEYGQVLETPLEWSFETGDFNPFLNVPTGMRLVGANNPAELPMQHLNVEGLHTRIARLDPSSVNPFSWQAYAERSTAGASRIDIASGPVPNAVARADVAFNSALVDGFGWIATDVSTSNMLDWEKKPRHSRSLLVVTDLAGTLKLSPGASEVWVTSLSSGDAQEDVQVELLRGNDVVATAQTGADGRVSFDTGPQPGWRPWGDAQYWARLTKSSDVSLVTQHMNDGIGPWNFSIHADFEPRGYDVAGHGFADRGVYRPGDPIYARATFRKQSAKGLETPNAKVAWKLSSPDGDEVAEGEGELDERGGFNIETALPDDGMLGGWDLVVEAKGEGWSERVYISIPAHAYREPAYRVSVSADSDAIAGDAVTATAHARYLFGAPLPRAEVSWSTWTEKASFDPEGWDGWSFGPAPTGWWEDEEYGGNTSLSREVTELLDGTSSFEETVSDLTEPVRLFLEAGVEDIDRQYIAASASTFIHPAEAYAAVRAGERMPVAGEETWVEVAAVDTKGVATTGLDLQLEVKHTSWDSVREKGMDGRWRWVTNKTETPVHSETLTSASSAANVRFTPSDTGRHTVVVTAKDGKGRKTVAEETLWVIGSGYAAWARRDDGLLALVPDKEVYAPGDTARILVQSPMPGLKALVSVEREGVLSSEMVELESTAQTIEIPITAAHRPNIYVSVVAVSGAGPQDAPDKGRPEVLVGMKELSVETEGEHLAVTVSPTKEVYRPRDEVEVKVKVERAGAAVAGAGVTLYAVDEAVLSLTNYQTPDAHGAMYVDRPLSTLTADARTSVLDRSSYLTKGANRGGGGGYGDGPKLRTDFVTTVTWQPDLKTGPDGTVTAKFTLKDNLTTFRVMAVVDADDTGFGSGDREITVTRPLIARPALPRVMRPGDTAFAGIVVHNNSDEVSEIVIEAKVEGPVTLEGSPTTIFLAPGNAREVPFKLSATGEGEATFDFTISDGIERDGVRHSFDVVKDLVREVVA
ncbi:MAG: Ig-like domain-containing protein, partial [Proteobacteria bacterium]|nr:Ig-like domain-containing protein [Pseudomonadota bacterium]